jgi:hypothetical protein
MNGGPINPTEETMKTTTMHLGIALLAGIATAQEPSPPERHRPPPHVPPILIIFDADRDGVISEDEIDDAPDALAKLDRNNDGQITREELMPPPPEGGKPPKDGNRPEGGKPPGPPPGHRPPPPVIAALDANRDGKLSVEELEDAADALLELDKNGDGELSPQELHPHGPPPPPPGEGAPDGEPE